MQAGAMMDLFGGNVGQTISRLESRGLLNYAWWLSCARTAGRLRQAAPGARHMHAAKGFGAFRPARCGVVCDPHPDTAYRQAMCRPVPYRPCSGYATTRKGGKVQTRSKDEGCSDVK